MLLYDKRFTVRRVKGKKLNFIYMLIYIIEQKNIQSGWYNLI